MPLIHFSPDGQRLVIDILSSGNLDVWVYDEWICYTLTRLRDMLAIISGSWS